MERRTFLGGAGAAGVGLCAGCLGGSKPSAEEALRSRWGDPPYTESDDGNLVVRVVVVNTTGDSYEATLYAYVELDGETYTETAAVSLDGSETEVYELPFEDVKRDEFSNGTIRKDLE